MKHLLRIFFVSSFILTCSACFLSTHAMDREPRNIIEFYNIYVKGKGLRTLDEVEYFGQEPFEQLNFYMKRDVRIRYNAWKREHGSLIEQPEESSEEIILHQGSSPEEVLTFFDQKKNKITLINIAKHIFNRDKAKVEDTGGRGESIGYVANKMCTHGFRVADLWKHRDTKYPTVKGEEMKERFGVSGRQFLQINTKDQLNVFSENLTPEVVLKFISENIDKIFTIENIELEYAGPPTNKFYRIAITFPFKNSGHYYEDKKSNGTILNNITIHFSAQKVIEDLLEGGMGMGMLGDVKTICPS